ncbi:MAG: CbiX/SirB N-terminal domain-containing protein, partial [Acidimicrobiales bacterium]
SDPDANADLYKIARLLHEGSPYPFVEACFAGITGPRLSQGLERCRRLGARWVVVVPYLLFTGVLVERISVQVAPLPSATVARHLWPDDRIARLILARYREAIEGDPRMNCDLCIYRVALPGFEHRVGSAAVPHHHPHVPVTS